MKTNLTLAEYVILRQLEATPSQCPYDLYRALQGTDWEVPMQTVYRVVRSLWELCAIEKDGDPVPGATNSLPKQRYVLSDAGESSLADIRTFFATEPTDERQAA